MKHPRWALALVALGFALSVQSAATAQHRYEWSTPYPPSVVTPNTVTSSIGKLEFFDGVPMKSTVKKVYAYVDRARAVDVYIRLLPVVSLYTQMRAEAEGGAVESHQVLFHEELADAKARFLTTNNTTLYLWAHIDLEKNGPTVIESPPGVLGVLDDMNFRYLTDIGVAGPDKGKGGKYLILPPGYQGEVPKGYFVVRSKTFMVWNFMRGYLDKGIEWARDNIKNNLKVYPLSRKRKPPKMQFINASGMALDAVPPRDFSFYESLNAVVQKEPLDLLDPETRGQVAAIGIVKGQPFKPDARMKKILTDAAAIGEAYARANTHYPRDPGQPIYKDTDSEWIMGFADKDTYFLKDGARRLDARLWMHYNAIVVTPAMALTRPGKGSDYGIANLDENHRPMDGAKTYRLHLPANPPVKDFWAVTLYDTMTRTLLQTDQRFTTVDSYREGLEKNADGSIDIYFAPKPPKGKENNWLQTIPGKSWFIILRMYGPLAPWIDQTWRPSELELVE
ncbi:MAG: DUF1254 domain-containing protein [Polyangiales bacterium]